MLAQTIVTENKIYGPDNTTISVFGIGSGYRERETIYVQVNGQRLAYRISSIDEVNNRMILTSVDELIDNLSIMDKRRDPKQPKYTRLMKKYNKIK